MPKNKNGDYFFTPTPPQNGGINISVVRFHFWVGFKPILKYRSFWPVFGPFSLEHGQKTKSADLQLKMRPNQEVEEKKSFLELNFTLKFKWESGFEFGDLEGNIT